MLKKIWNEIKWGAKEAVQGLGFTLYLMFAVASVIGSMFGIAWMIDEISQWCFLLFIPWFILLAPWIKLLSKPVIKWGEK